MSRCAQPCKKYMFLQSGVLMHHALLLLLYINHFIFVNPFELFTRAICLPYALGFMQYPPPFLLHYVSWKSAYFCFMYEDCRHLILCK